MDIPGNQGNLVPTWTVFFILCPESPTAYDYPGISCSQLVAGRGGAVLHDLAIASIPIEAPHSSVGIIFGYRIFSRLARRRICPGCAGTVHPFLYFVPTRFYRLRVPDCPVFAFPRLLFGFVAALVGSRHGRGVGGNLPVPRFVALSINSNRLHIYRAWFQRIAWDVTGRGYYKVLVRPPNCLAMDALHRKNQLRALSRTHALVPELEKNCYRKKSSAARNLIRSLVFGCDRICTRLYFGLDLLEAA